MCGRYAASFSPDDIADEFDVDEDRTDEHARSVLVNPQQPPAGAPDWNMAPTKQSTVVLTRVPKDDPDNGPVRQLRLMTWGLVPSWSRDTKVGLRMINARSETLLDKGAFAKAAVGRRCLVPADGWYEWQVSQTATDAKGKPRKQPFFIHPRDGGVLAMAGLYEIWRDPDRAEDDPDRFRWTCTVLTTTAEDSLGHIHDRMPLMVERDRWSAWLDPRIAGETSLLVPAAPGALEAYPVDTRVNNVRNNGPELVEPLPVEEATS